MRIGKYVVIKQREYSMLKDKAVIAHNEIIRLNEKIVEQNARIEEQNNERAFLELQLDESNSLKDNYYDICCKRKFIKCPACGGDCITESDTFDGYHTRCLDCGARTKNYEKYEDAENAWRK